ncbi:Transmembrane protein 81 [Willisornis vidua]|uniref:Transmembrane protein 81 n=1 Tax=Willisornis vidua TaxID=1566151 RepID=A0ABQ9CS44_9PASS|nr:Transmembrane protein 81 [Willisornis vidua]
MKALEQSLIPGGLLWFLCALCALAAAVPVAPALRSAVIKVTVNSTPCSVTCGLGLKVEELCEVTPGGEMKNCSLLHSLCLSSWICGLQHVSVPAGRPLRLSCLAPNLSGFGNHTYGYTWRRAPGLITTNDLLFQPFPNPQPTLSLAPATEAHAGTYRCDVQLRQTFKLVKRIYFGLKVIPRDLVDLSFQKSLTWAQKLVANLGQGSAGNGSREGEQRFWEKETFSEVVLGVGSGVMVGVLLSLLLCCCQWLCRRRAAQK